MAVEVTLAKTIDNIRDDSSLKLMVDNMMALDVGTTLLAIVRECFDQFGERYYGMKQKDWFHIVNQYVSEVTKRYDLEPEEPFCWMAAEPPAGEDE